MITVYQDREWHIADPRLGAFVVVVDGKRIGAAPVHGEITTSVELGSHSVRIRQWWFRSPTVVVEAHEGEHVRLRADIDKSVGVLRRMFKSSSLVLRPESS